MKNNYEAAYFLVPLAANNKIAKDGSEVVYYIVCKCNVVCKAKLNEMNGGHQKRYIAVFPYFCDNHGDWHIVNLGDFNDGLRLYPNNFTTDRRFNSIEDARQVKDDKNTELLGRMLATCPPDEQESKSGEFKQIARYYDAIEKCIDESLKGVPITANVPEQKTYIYYNTGKLIVSIISLYDMLEMGTYDNLDYTVYEVSPDEYKNLEDSAISTPSELREFFHTPLINHHANDAVIQIVPEDCSEKPVLYADRKDLYRMRTRDMGEGYNFPVLVKRDMVIFTVETYDSVVESYRLTGQTKDISNEDIQLVLKRNTTTNI